MDKLALNKILDSIDPKDNYKGTVLEGMDAFERQLKRFSIKIPSSEKTSLEALCQRKIAPKVCEAIADASLSSEGLTSRISDEIVILIDRVEGL